MNVQAYKVAALFRKDWKDTLKNGNCLLLCILPLGMAALYTFLDFGGVRLDPLFVLTIGLLMNLSLLPLSATSMMIAEEKEKNTLRTLMLSNVSASEFLLSKALVILLLMQLVNLGVYALVGTEVISLPYFLLLTTCAIPSIILLGALIGLVSKNQMSTGMFAAPLALLLMLPTMFAQISEGISRYARFLPTYAVIQLISQPENGHWFSIMVLIAWTILATIAFVLIYRRKRFD